MNQWIRARDVRVIGEEGEQLGVMPLVDARRLADERSLDLVEVAPGSDPPVCRLLDFGKFRYAQAKKERQASKAQRSTGGLREIRMRPKIGQHDIEFKVRAIKKLLEEGNKVKVLVIFRGREIAHPNLGKEILDGVLETLGDSAKVERALGMEGRSMTVILSSGKQAKVEPKGEKNAETENP
ncbi:MAG: translation initiation factor IF-3 [Dehalococcoidia bacterium]|nr:translation initiation factor IF-3 [Dehalococcoidia bacterium]